MTTIGTWWMWVGFFSLITLLMVVDLVFWGGRKIHRVSVKEAFVWTGVWITIALLFNLLLWLYLSHHFGRPVGNQKALEFLTGYLIEKSLSIDNIFIFLVIFNYFTIPAEYQRRVLLYGVLGAIVMRLVLILLGIWLVSRFYWVLYIFGIFLVATGIKMFWFAERQPTLANNPLLRWMKNHLRATDTLQDEKFTVRKQGLLYVTPLFLVIILIEASDLIFAVDSIPAIFAVTTDPFIIFTSNIFAILGLRAMYFLLANMSERFHLLKYGIAIILVLVGAKLIVAHWYALPVWATLVAIVLILGACIILSIWKKKQRTSLSG